MKATYYAIREFNQASQKVGDIIDEGIVEDCYSNIYPGQTTDYPDLPHECELRHFKHPDYMLEMCEFELTRDHVRMYRKSGDLI